jgi:hypothetical protein
VAVFGFKGGQTRVEQLALGDDDDVEARSDLVATKNLSYQSFSSISLDGSAELPRRRDPETADPKLIGQDEQRRVTPVDAGAAFVDVLKVRAPPDPLVRPEPGHI